MQTHYRCCLVCMSVLGLLLYSSMHGKFPVSKQIKWGGEGSYKSRLSKNALSDILFFFFLVCKVNTLGFPC